MFQLLRQPCAAPVCVSALSGVLGGSAATALLEGDTSLTGDPSTEALANILVGRFAEAVLFLSDVPGGERTEYPAETDTLPLGTESPAHPIDRPGRYDSPIAEQEGWSSELPIAGPAYGDHTSGGYQILDPETQQLIGGAVYSEDSTSIRQYADGSFRAPDGKFASQGGLPAPGTRSAQEYTQFLRDNGFDVVGEELTVSGAVSTRRYDAVVRTDSGELWGVE